MSSDAFFSLVLRAHKARSIADINRCIELIVDESDRRNDLFEKKYKDSERVFYNNLGRGRFE